ncbi:MAG: hypothetical protein Q8N83_06540 [Ignavibacteria bacterium]|nr:hypothetical protein [Ignavibacteria bacterium]
MNLSSIDLNFIVAFSAIIISIAALLLTAMTLKIQREHNFSSTRPICFVDVFDYSNHTAVELYNGGIGPMILNDIKVSMGVEYKRNIIEWMPQIDEGLRWKNFNTDMNLTVVPAGTSLTMIAFAAEEENNAAVNFRNQIRKKMSALTVEVTYSNIYDKQLPVVTRSLDIFGRRTSWDNSEEQREPMATEVTEEKNNDENASSEFSSAKDQE